MTPVTYHGPATHLRLKSGRMLRRGEAVSVPDSEAARLDRSSKNVTVHWPDPDPEPVDES